MSWGQDFCQCCCLSFWPKPSAPRYMIMTTGIHKLWFDVAVLCFVLVQLYRSLQTDRIYVPIIFRVVSMAVEQWLSLQEYPSVQIQSCKKWLIGWAYMYIPFSTSFKSDMNIQSCLTMVGGTLAASIVWLIDSGCISGHVQLSAVYWLKCGL